MSRYVFKFQPQITIMKTSRCFLATFVAIALFISFASRAGGQGALFTYQGRLGQNGSPATGIYDFRFEIYDAVTNGNALTAPQMIAASPVTEGVFVATLDFGSSVFTGAPRWLGISIRTNGGGTFSTLSPRQPLTASPYAIMAINASNRRKPQQLSRRPCRRVFCRAVSGPPHG
jgi:hypothetical protein